MQFQQRYATTTSQSLTESRFFNRKAHYQPSPATAKRYHQNRQLRRSVFNPDCATKIPRRPLHLAGEGANNICGAFVRGYLSECQREGKASASTREYVVVESEFDIHRIRGIFRQRRKRCRVLYGGQRSVVVSGDARRFPQRNVRY